jgi:hypothetical protein
MAANERKGRATIEALKHHPEASFCPLPSAEGSLIRLSKRRFGKGIP